MSDGRLRNLRRGFINLYIAFFFANPLTEKLACPVVYGQLYQDSTILREVTLNFNGKTYPVKLEFKPYQSLFLLIAEKGGVRFGDI